MPERAFGLSSSTLSSLMKVCSNVKGVNTKYVWRCIIVCSGIRHVFCVRQRQKAVSTLTGSLLRIADLHLNDNGKAELRGMTCYGI